MLVGAEMTMSAGSPLVIAHEKLADTPPTSTTEPSARVSAS